MYIIATVGLLILLTGAFALAAFASRRDEDSSGFFAAGAVVSGALAIVIVVCNLFTQVEGGMVGVQKVFGAVQMAPGATLHEGFTRKNLVSAVIQMSTRQQNIEFLSGNPDEGSLEDAVVVYSYEGAPMHIEASQPFALNPEYASRVYHAIGGDERYPVLLIRPASSSAIREAAASFGALEMGTSKRAEFAAMVQNETRGAILAQLRTLEDFQELPDEELAQVFRLGQPQIKEVSPGSKIANAVNEKLAAVQLAERQRTLNEVEQLKISQSEFLGDQLKAISERVGGNGEEASQLLKAWARETEANALMKLVESDVPTSVTIITGGASPAVTASR
jgi:regulator of protease activity HflC (stomatin/prohibitin superfamily)